MSTNSIRMHRNDSSSAVRPLLTEMEESELEWDKNHMQRLPSEILGSVISYLDKDSRIALRCVSKSMQKQVDFFRISIDPCRENEEPDQKYDYRLREAREKYRLWKTREKEEADERCVTIARKIIYITTMPITIPVISALSLLCVPCSCIRLCFCCDTNFDPSRWIAKCICCVCSCAFYDDPERSECWPSRFW